MALQIFRDVHTIFGMARSSKLAAKHDSTIAPNCHYNLNYLAYIVRSW